MDNFGPAQKTTLGQESYNASYHIWTLKKCLFGFPEEDNNVNARKTTDKTQLSFEWPSWYTNVRNLQNVFS